MGASLSNDDTLDELPAAHAGLSLLLVDAHVIVVLASLTP